VKVNVVSQWPGIIRPEADLDAADNGAFAHPLVSLPTATQLY
jgi:hypothetical protein